MSNKITAGLISEQAVQLHGLDVAAKRCAELAGELERHNTAIRDAVQQLDFNDEPACFNARLAAHAQPRKPRA